MMMSFHLANYDVDFDLFLIEITNISVILQANLIKNNAVWQKMSESKIQVHRKENIFSTSEVSTSSGERDILQIVTDVLL